MTTTSIREFYQETIGSSCQELNSFLEDQTNHDIGHVNVFRIADIMASCGKKGTMPYNRRNYYKISLIKGHNRVEYADKTVDILHQGMLFATPRIPYRYTPLDTEQDGHFVVFTRDFLAKSKTGLNIDRLPIFSSRGDFVYQLTDEDYAQFESVYDKMQRELQSDYTYKYDLIRNYVMELIHLGQKLTPMEHVTDNLNASTRIFSLFIELLERQFPIETPTQMLNLRSAKDFAARLGVHVNHLNKVLKEITGKTTTDIISSRINQEAKILLKHTDWNVSEIAYSLGFEEVAHFSNFFKRNSQLSPSRFRSDI